MSTFSLKKPRHLVKTRIRVYTFILWPPHLSAHTAPAPAGSRAESASGICSPCWVLPVARPGSARIAFFRSSEFGFRISARVIPVWPGVCFASNCDLLTFWGFFGGSARVYSPHKKGQTGKNSGQSLGRRLPRECDRAGLIPGVSPVQRTSCSLR